MTRNTAIADALFWNELNTQDFAGLAADTTIASSPIASHRAAWTASAFRNRRGDQWHAGGAPPSAAGLDILVRPTQEIGKANEHVYGAGTLSLGAELLIPVWTAIGAKVAEAGIVERELRVRYQSRYRVVLT